MEKASGHEPLDVEAAFRREAPALLGYFTRRVSPTEDAADLLSETFLIAWRKRNRVTLAEATVRPWLYGIARKMLAQHRRGSMRRHALADRVRRVLRESAVAGLDGTANPEDELSEHVRSLVGLLDPLDQEIVTLVYWEGFSQEDVARIVGKPASTVRSRLTRARALLRSQLAESGEVEPGETPGADCC